MTSEGAVAPTADVWSGRPTRALIDLDALARNVAAIRKHAAGRPLLAVVKANAYGHGAVHCAAAALRAGASYLGVYTVQEGIVLRRAGIDAPILIFGPFQRSEAADIVQHGLRPTITNLTAAEYIVAAQPSSPVPYHFKIDTGLTRAGASPVDAISLLRRLSGYPALTPEGVFTHFACADEPHRPENGQQLRSFLASCEALESEGFHFRIRHAANSAASLTMPEAHFDMLRCGLGIYGCYPSPATAGEVPLSPVMSLVSRIVRVSMPRAGTGVGYGHEYLCRDRSRIALVPVGYGDGLPRSLGCGNGRVLVRGRAVPIVGRVSMDQITVDVTDVPAANLGDEVVVIGHQHDAVQTADEVASRAGTINYEILCRVMPRVPRAYLRGGEVVAVADLISAEDTIQP